MKGKKVLVTGAAGFIGSHVAQGFLNEGYIVVGIDSFYSGLKDNLKVINDGNFTFIEGDIRDLEACKKACEGVDVISHHAAIGSVVKSIEDPDFVRDVNVGGFQNILDASNVQGVQRVVYASSCAVYGDAGEGAIAEDQALNPLSPYAEGKIQNERDAAASEIENIGFRYFNIYGPRQDPNGAYAAVLPKWLDAMKSGQQIQIFGNGETMRDFCHVADVVRANIIAATTKDTPALGQIYNIGSGQGTTLNALFALLKEHVGYDQEPDYLDFRSGDIRVSKADISKAKNILGFEAQTQLKDGIQTV